MSIIFEEFQHPAIQSKIEQHLGAVFSLIKVRQPIGSEDSARIYKLCAEVAGGWRHFCI